MLGLVDWELLVLFIGPVRGEPRASSRPASRRSPWPIAGRGGHATSTEPAPLFVATLMLSNVVSNVPAGDAAAARVAEHALRARLLALVSTLAGNLFIVGSIANIIVVDAAARRGIRIDWRRHARVGVPVTLITLAICAASLWWGALPAARIH